MEDIISKIVVNKKDKDKDKDYIYDRIELELNLKIEREKTKQLELIKDIRKIEKTIKEKELYCKRKNTTYSNSESEYESDSESESESNSDSESNSESESDCKNTTNVYLSQSKSSFIGSFSNIKRNKSNNKLDSISMCSIDSDYDADKEIDLI